MSAEPTTQDDFPSRTLRTWAVADVVYAAILVVLALAALPWKLPAANIAIVVYAVLCAASAPGLWRARRWAWMLALGTSLLGLAATVVVVSLLVASWAYLRAIYGAFGAGASIASLLIAGLVAEVLGLHPALRLRALLRREIRRSMGARGRALVAATMTLALLPVPVGLATHLRYRLRPLDPLPVAAQTQALAVVRAALAGRTAPAAPALAGLALGPGPLFGTLWEEGRPVARAQGHGRDLGEAAANLGRALGARAGGATRGRLKLERVVAAGPILRSPAVLLGLSIDPGLDGLRGPDQQTIFLPDDVLLARSAGASAPLPDLPELRLGIGRYWLHDRLADATGAGPPLGGLERFRTEGWIESSTGAVVGLHRGREDPPPPLSARAAATAAGDFILRQIQTDGRFAYRYDPVADTGMGQGEQEYSYPRHAGTAYGLALIHAFTGEARFREGADAGLSWLARQIAPTCGGKAQLGCLVPEGAEAPLGAASLAAIAMLEYDRRTGDRRYRDLARRLLELALTLQRPDGEFDHVFDSVAGTVVPGPPRMFASEQTALALALGQELLGDARYLPALERALDFLTVRKYHFFLGRFIYGADHWTCIAAEEAWPALKHRRYLDFCAGYAHFMRRLQYQDTTGPTRDFAGHYGFGYLMVPQAPATAGFAEALLSTLALAQHHQAPSDQLRAQTTAALRALARDQIRADNGYTMGHLPRALGGIRRSLVEPEIRIDFVQHAASALARGTALGMERL
jgi:hypothetical protein